MRFRFGSARPDSMRPALASRNRLRAALVLLAAWATLAPPVETVVRAASPEPVTLGDLSFDPRVWVVIERGDTLVFAPSSRTYSSQGRLKVGPAQPAARDIAAERERIWAQLSAGQQVQGSYNINEGAVNYGGNSPNANYSLHSAYFRSGGCAGVMIIEANGQMTPFVMAVETSQGCSYLMDTFYHIMGSLAVAPRSAPPSAPPGARVGGISAGSPSDQGADPYDSIKWEGPDEFTDGIYDIHPIHPHDELTKAVLLNGSFIGSVKPKDLTFAEALAHVRLLLDTPHTKTEYEGIKKQMSGADPFMLKGVAFTQVVSGDPLAALLSLLVAYEYYPNDPDSLVNLAAMLAHCGLPNESLAVLKEMERRSMKPKPAAIDPDALMEYLKGFNQLLIGQTTTGKYHLHQAIIIDPFLKEAALALALAQKLTGEEEEAEKTYYYGVWRRRPTQYLLCGGTSSDPYVRPPITDMLDVSRGKPGVLPQFDHPGNYAQALGLFDRYRKALTQVREEAQGFGQQSVAIGKRLSARPKNADEVYAEYIDFLQSTLSVEEPPVMKLLEAKNIAEKEAKEASVRIAQQAAKIAIPVMMQPGDHTAELRAIANDAVSAFRPFAQAYDLAVRRYFRTWNRYATGLAVHMGDPDWHDKEDLAIRLEADTEWVSLVTPISGWYTGLAAFGPVKDPSGDAATPNHGAIDRCPPALRGMGMKVSFSAEVLPLEKVSFSMNFTCEKKSFEVGYKPLSIDSGILQESVGVFGSLDIGRKGDMTLAVGVKGSFGVPHAGDVSGKGAIYVTADAKGNITDGGLKGSANVFGNTGEGTLTAGDLKNMAVDFIPSFAAPARGPSLRQ